jgi:hypothetical protein
MLVETFDISVGMGYLIRDRWSTVRIYVEGGPL